ncbi:MAG TPA: hypothetical protein VK590_09115, partial [Saprospiraceae bacterium]|nr:hypothetical protein [Saprospiraceae bacterium]
MKINIKAYLFILFLFGCFTLIGQYQFPFRIDNYAGMQAGIFNPAATLTQIPKWEVDLVSGGLFIDNNIAYLQNTSTLSLLSNKPNLKPATTITSEKPINSGDLIYDFFYNNNKKYIIQNAYVGLPGFVMQI